jgi:ribosome recycling factor
MHSLADALLLLLFLLQLGAAVVKAIRDSPLSLNPTNEGNEVLVKLPRLTKDTIGAQPS